MCEVVIVSAARTALGSFGGSLASVPAVELGAEVIRAALSRGGVDAGMVEEVIMGNVLQAGLGQNPARQAAVKAGIPVEIPAWTVNKVCGSGLKAVAEAALAIRAGEARCVVAGGMEGCAAAEYTDGESVLFKELLLSPDKMGRGLAALERVLPGARCYVRTPALWDGMKGSYLQPFGMIKWYSAEKRALWGEGTHGYMGLGFD